MSKLALVINKIDYSNFLFNLGDNKLNQGKHIHEDGNDLLKFIPRLVDRSICEQDASTLQIIPYVTLAYLKDDGSNIPSPADPDTKFFIYTRGEAGNEGRLHGKCSLGLGGHIEEGPTDTKTFEKVIIDATLRELNEEVGLELDGFEAESDFCILGNLFFDSSDPVGLVHLGLSITLFVNPDDLKSREDGVITKGQWLTLSEIQELQNNCNDPIILENWSKMYLEYNTNENEKKTV